MSKTQINFITQSYSRLIKFHNNLVKNSNHQTRIALVYAISKVQLFITTFMSPVLSTIIRFNSAFLNFLLISLCDLIVKWICFFSLVHMTCCMKNSELLLYLRLHFLSYSFRSLLCLFIKVLLSVMFLSFLYDWSYWWWQRNIKAWSSDCGPAVRLGAWKVWPPRNGLNGSKCMIWNVL